MQSPRAPRKRYLRLRRGGCRGPERWPSWRQRRPPRRCAHCLPNRRLCATTRCCRLRCRCSPRYCPSAGALLRRLRRDGCQAGRLREGGASQQLVHGEWRWAAQHCDCLLALWRMQSCVHWSMTHWMHGALWLAERGGTTERQRTSRGGSTSTRCADAAPPSAHACLWRAVVREQAPAVLCWGRAHTTQTRRRPRVRRRQERRRPVFADRLQELPKHHQQLLCCRLPWRYSHRLRRHPVTKEFFQAAPWPAQGRQVRLTAARRGHR